MEEKNLENQQKGQEEKKPEEKPRIVYHTLESDLKELRESGGQPDFESKGKKIEFDNEIKEAPQEVSEEAPKKEPAFLEEMPEPKMEVISPPSFKEKEEEKPLAPSKKKISSRLLIIILILGGVLILGGLLGYFFVYPNYFKKEEISETFPKEEPEEKPSAPSLEEEYVSLLVSPANLRSEGELSALSLILLRSLLEKEAGVVEEIGTLKEIVIYYQNRPLSFYDFFRTILPEVMASEQNLDLTLEELFEKQLTVTLFYGEKAIQLAYLGLIKPQKKAEVEKLVRDLIENPNLKISLKNSHFLLNPGKPIFEVFKEGKIGPCKTFYLPYENANLAINFGICENYFLVASSKANVEKIISSLYLEEK